MNKTTEIAKPLELESCAKQILEKADLYCGYC